MRSLSMFVVSLMVLAVLGTGCGQEANDGPRYDPHDDHYVPKALRPGTPVEDGEETVGGLSAQATGEEVYATYCLVCHQADGSGVPSMQPPLQHSNSLNNDLEDAIRRVLYGVMPGGKGPEPRSEYANVMTPFGFLSDEQIARVLSYVREEFADVKDPVAPEQVATVREKYGE